MRKADLSKNHQKFESTLVDYANYLDRLLNALRVVRPHDKKEIAEGAFLKLCARWESFVDEELVDCVNIDCSKLADFVDAQLPKNLSLDMCRAIIFRGGYLDFRSVAQLKEFAKKILPDHVNPFRLIRSLTARKIDEMLIIRNYLSHYSRKARRALFAIYKQSYSMQVFREPAHFLLANRARRFIEYFRALMDASDQMKGII